jgi:hypothetical protein
MRSNTSAKLFFWYQYVVAKMYTETHSVVLRVITPRSLVDGYHCFKGMYYLDHHFSHFNGGNLFLWHVGKHLPDNPVSVLRFFMMLKVSKLYIIELVKLINWKGFARKLPQSNWDIPAFVGLRKTTKTFWCSNWDLTKHILNMSLCQPTWLHRVITHKTTTPTWKLRSHTQKTFSFSVDI